MRMILGENGVDAATADAILNGIKIYKYRRASTLAPCLIRPRVLSGGLCQQDVLRNMIQTIATW